MLQLDNLDKNSILNCQKFKATLNILKKPFIVNEDKKSTTQLYTVGTYFDKQKSLYHRQSNNHDFYCHHSESPNKHCFSLFNCWWFPPSVPPRPSPHFPPSPPLPTPPPHRSSPPPTLPPPSPPPSSSPSHDAHHGHMSQEPFLSVVNLGLINLFTVT